MIGKFAKLTRWRFLRSSFFGSENGTQEIINTGEIILILSEITTSRDVSYIKALKGNAVGYIYWYYSLSVPFEII